MTESLDHTAVAYRVAIAAAQEASQIVMEWFPSPTNPAFNAERGLAIIDKQTGVGNFSTPADEASDSVIRRTIDGEPLLAGSRFASEDPSKEDARQALRMPGQPWWNIDSIDGTNNFASGDPNFGISIGYHDRHNQPVVGVVALPATGQIAAARHGHGAKLIAPDNSELDLTAYAQGLPQLPADNKLRIAYDIGYVQRAEQIARAAGIADRIGALLSYNSSSFSIVSAATGRLDAFFTTSPTIYDIGAATSLLEEIGGKVSGIHGQPIDWDAQQRTFLGARTPQIHARVLQLLQSQPFRRRL